MHTLAGQSLSLSREVTVGDKPLPNSHGEDNLSYPPAQDRRRREETDYSPIEFVRSGHVHSDQCHLVVCDSVNWAANCSKILPCRCQRAEQDNLSPRLLVCNETEKE